MMDRSSDASSEFFSPVHNDMSLPIGDTSWIGARMSPIHSFDNEDEEEEHDHDDYNAYTRAYQRALHDSLEAADFIVPNERSSLLRNDSNSKTAKHHNLHPLWDPPPPTDSPSNTTKSWYHLWGLNWETGICLISGSLLAAMGILDPILDDDTASFSSRQRWSWPLGMPPEATLARFGALVYNPDGLLYSFWWLLTSMGLTVSVSEWILVVGAWRMVLLDKNKNKLPWWTWTGTYLGSVLAGQVNMLAFDSTVITAGCVSWGTCGVLTGLGVIRPTKRLALYPVAILMILIILLEVPYNSVIGVVASAFWGWAATMSTRVPCKAHHETSQQLLLRWTCGCVAAFLVVLPILWILLLGGNSIF